MASIKRNPKSGKWYARVSYKKQDGTYGTKTKTGFEFKKDAQAWAASIEKQKSSHATLESNTMPFAEFFETWCRTYRMPATIAASTAQSYKTIISQVRNYFGAILLRDVTRQHMQRFMDDLAETKAKASLMQAKRTLNACMRYAQDEGIITRNPIANVLINAKKQRSERSKFWQVEEYQKLLSHVSADATEPVNMVVLIALLTGARIGEIFAMRWDDFGADTVSINRTYSNKDHTINKPKTASSVRTISIPQALSVAVKAYRIRVQRRHPDYLFIDSFGRPFITFSHFRTNFKRLCGDAGVPELTVHSTRHTHCSILIGNGMEIYYVSRRLGHSNISVTTTVYAHLLRDFEQTQNEKARDIFAKLVQKIL